MGEDELIGGSYLHLIISANYPQQNKFSFCGTLIIIVRIGKRGRDQLEVEVWGRMD